MSAKLEQLLGYLDRPGVTEIIVGVGRPITVKLGEGYTPLTSLPVTELQFQTLLGTTSLAAFVKSGSKQPTTCEVGRRRVRVELIRRGDETALRIQPAPAEPVLPTAKFATTIRTPRVPAAPAAATATATPVAASMTAVSAAPAIDAPVHAGASAAASTLDVRSAAAPEPARAAPEPAVESTASLGELPAGDVAGSELIDERVDASPIAHYVRAARRAGASDLHVAADRPLHVRVGGELRALESQPLPASDVERMLLALLGPRRRAQLQTRGYVDLAFDVPEAGRLRGNISRQQGGLRGAFRLAHMTPPTLDELGLPAQLAKVVTHHQGLVVIAGPNGQGKTTTLAALVDLVNSSKPYHIITIEDPVELEHPRKLAVISQREVGRHTKSFAAALKASLREDPDVIVIGELRDRETVEIALTAAETGHLVLATMSTPSAAKTIDRLIDMFPPADQTQARASIAGALRAVVAQRLLPARGGGVVPAVEMVTGVLPLAVLIRDDKLYQLPNLMQRGRAFGMIRFEDSVGELLAAGKIDEDVARQYAPGLAKGQLQTRPLGLVGKRE